MVCVRVRTDDDGATIQHGNCPKWPVVIPALTLTPILRLDVESDQTGAMRPTTEAAGQGAGDCSGPGSAPPGIFDELSRAFGAARATLSGFLELLSLEARRAGLALLWMLVLAVIAAVCIVAAWLGLMVALAMWAVMLGLPLIAAVIAVAAMNLLAGAVLIYVGIRMRSALLFSATRRRLSGAPPLKPSAP